VLAGGWGACVLAARPAWAQAGAPRVALVVGNAAYAGAPLPNAANDARAMGAALQSMGFEVIELRDASKARMEEAIALSRAMLQGRNGVGLLYYAGHGLQVDWHNYMVPVDARFEAAADVPRLAVDIQGAIDAFRMAGNRMNIVVLDACRDNPFAATATGKGLAPLDAPPGTFLAYATAPGNVAEDGSAADGNGLYTRYLLTELQRPQAAIEEVFKRVRLQVRRASNGRQIPWESTSLEDEFVFASGDKVAATPASDRDAAFQAELRDWERVKDSTQPEDMYAFLSSHPNGRISELAQFRLDQFSRPKVLAMAPAGLRVLPSGADRYAVGDTWVFERTDAVTGQQTRPRFEVTALDGPRVVVNQGTMVLDQMGGVLRNRFGTKTPAFLIAPADVQLGKRWRSAFSNRAPNGALFNTYYDSHVAALEEIEVPAGRFRCYRIEARGEGQNGSGGRRLQTTNWLDPQTMLIVQQTVHQTVARTGEVVEDFRDRLLQRTLVPRR